MRILVVSAHPDDETLGCGGTLLGHKSAGDEMSWLIATRAYEPVWPADIVAVKEREIEAVGKAYGMKTVIRFGIKATHVEEEPQSSLVRMVGEVVRETRPEIVYIVHSSDIHSDHRTLHAACMAAMKSFKLKAMGVRKVACFETLSSTDAGSVAGFVPFAPNMFVDICGFMDGKVAIMKMYATEMHDEFGPRSESAIRGLGRVRGSAIGVEYAEAFRIMVDIV